MLNLLPPAMQDDEQVVCWAVWSGGSDELAYASERVKNCRQVVEYACSVDCMALCHASPELKCDPQLLNACFAVVPATRLAKFRKKLDPAWMAEQKKLLKTRKLDLLVL